SWLFSANIRDQYYAALFNLFPNKCSVRDIYNKYHDLRIRFESGNRLPYPCPSTDNKTLGKIYKDECEELNIFNPCYRCGMLDCNRHEQLSEELEVASRKPVKPPLADYSTTACSFLCHYKFEERMAHQAENIRESRWREETGDWLPFTYTVVQKRDKKKVRKAPKRKVA
ncbi:hypothetical protein PFISCL1PPCAC_5505, partial [Pristionchus fissidentatus]